MPLSLSNHPWNVPVIRGVGARWQMVTPKAYSTAAVFRSWSPRSARPYEIQTEDTILFLEDLAAKPYQVDRMLMQLKLAGKLDDVRGLSSAKCSIACKPRIKTIP